MKRTIVVLLASLALAACQAGAGTYYGFQVGITNAPPPPRLVFREEPHLILVPDTRVYVVEDHPGYDVFRVGGYWYTYDEGFWFRASSYSGPYVAIDVRRVPRPIFEVPGRYWKHHPHGGPPGQTRRARHHGH